MSALRVMAADATGFVTRAGRSYPARVEGDGSTWWLRGSVEGDDSPRWVRAGVKVAGTYRVDRLRELAAQRARS